MRVRTTRRLLGASLALAACGDDQAAGPAEATTSTGSPAATTTADAATATDGTADDAHDTTASDDATTTTGGPSTPEGPEASWAIVLTDDPDDNRGRLALTVAGDLLHLGSYVNRVSFDGDVLATIGSFGAEEIGATPDDGFVLLYESYNGPARIVAYDGTGTELWQLTFGDQVVLEGPHLAVSATGLIAITGNIGGELDFGEGPLPPIAAVDGFVALLDPDGAPIWTRRFPDDPFERTSRATFDPGGDLVFTGCATEPVDLGGVEASDCFVARVTSTGQNVFAVPGDRTRALETAGGSFYVLTPGGVQILDAGGAALGGAGDGDTVPYAVGPLADGGFIVGGSTTGSPFAVRSGIMRRHDASGMLAWERIFGDESQAGDRITDMVVVAGGDVIVAGLFHNELDLGSTTLVAEEGGSGFLARFPAAP